MKHKKVPFQNTAEQLAPGLWTFTTSGFVWQWREIGGVNLFLLHPQQGPLGFVYVKNLNEAGLFAEGYASGRLDQEKTELHQYLTPKQS